MKVINMPKRQTTGASLAISWSKVVYVEERSNGNSRLWFGPQFYLDIDCPFETALERIHR